MQHTVYLIGVGGVGSWLLPQLMKLSSKTDHRIHLFDGDRYEQKNLDRQLFPEQFIGRNKAAALAQFHGCDHTPQYLSAGYIRPAERDWIIVCADNNPARLLALQIADQCNCRVIIAANEYTDAEAYYYEPSYAGTKADPRVFYPAILDDVSDDPLRVGAGCAEQATSSPQLVVSNVAAAAYAAQLYWLHQNGTDVPARYRPIHHKSNELNHTSINHDTKLQ